MENQTKLRLLYLYQHLMQCTDAEHRLSTPQLIEILRSQYGIEVNRNTLADDFRMLEQAGIQIGVVHSQQNQYYYDGNLFDPAELKIMIDAISSSRFITEKKSRELIDKILTLTTDEQASRMRRHIQVEGRIKSENECGYHVVDLINEAIERGCKIRFQYADYSPKKRKVVRHNGQYYVVSPYALIWDGDYYYVIGYSEMRGKVQSFRTDRFYRIPKLMEEDSVPRPYGFDLKTYTRETFRMFGTESVETVTLLCENSVMNALIDYFGMQVPVSIVDEDHFRTILRVCPSPTFFRWVFGWNGKMRILGPDRVCEKYREMARRALGEEP
ncbi:MAG: WYL domain-containing protein [Clostridia bacterium]|nr:WYL domain-containing protein [Clostridia bacterium]